MKVVIIHEELQAYALHILQRYMSIADLEEVAHIAALARALKSAETLPEGPEVVNIPGPVEVVMDLGDDEPIGGTD